MEMEEKNKKDSDVEFLPRKIFNMFLRVCQLELLDRRTAGLTYYATGTTRKRRKEAAQ